MFEDVAKVNDKKVFIEKLPTEDYVEHSILEYKYLDSNGDVLFEDSFGGEAGE
ncbi:hypothetical protein [Bacillus sp. FJAT-27225]|uniref:hypothetical protein n=1 Tax=Bacillus sp. FJAT-27225 TaxID=1743144 RepID=UPI001586C6B5|nr:hypothetical protein [Bacillus sp. FJAT-27225]